MTKFPDPTPKKLHLLKHKCLAYCSHHSTKASSSLCQAEFLRQVQVENLGEYSLNQCVGALLGSIA